MTFQDDKADAFAAPITAFPRNAAPEPRGINWRWLVASAMMGALGCVLLVAALSASRNGSLVARRPERARASGREEMAAGTAEKKADNLVPSSFAISTAAHFRAGLSERSGEREISKVHAIAHVSIALSALPVGELAIPELDAIGTTAGDHGDATPEPADTADVDVSLTRRDLAELPVPPESPGLSDSAIDEQIAEVARLSAGAAQLPPDYSNLRILSRTLRMVGTATDADEQDQNARFGSLDVRIVPENLTDVPLSTSTSERFEEVDIVLAHGETLVTALRAHGASQERAAAIATAFGRRGENERSQGQHLRLTIGPAHGERTIQRAVLFDQSGPQAIVAERDQGSFVTVPVSQADRSQPISARPDPAEEDEGHGTALYQSFYAGALRGGVPREVIEDTIQAFAAETDLREHAGPGDRVELVFTEDETGADAHHELLYAALTADGETQQLYRNVAPETGKREFLAQDGVSPVKLLMRKPVRAGRISSPFGMRRHPILHYSRLHNGVDWAAPHGTPIFATGDGVVQAAGPHSGYGNRVEIEHANGYASAYNHMARITREITPGASVHRGDIIGYVGTTGLSTGPHVHYEVTANGHFVDPMKIRLPSSRILAGAALASFREQVTQIDALRTDHGRTALLARDSAHL